jgi:hypothetical protein
MLRLEAGVSHLFIKGMRFRPNDVAANGDLIESAPARPLLNRLDKTPSHAACPLAFGHNQSANLSHSTGHEELVLRAVNPTNDFSAYLRDENDVLLASAQSFETALHGFAIDWVAKNAAEFGHPGCISGSGSANNEIIHRHALLFKSNNPAGATLRFIPADLCTSLPPQRRNEQPAARGH